jgi:predicted O-methyltransferase YrrM
VRLWCRGAYAFELLDWDRQAGYRVAPEMASLLLDPTEPLFIGGRVQFYAALYEDFRAYPRYLKSGGTWPRSDHDPWLLEALKNMTKPDTSVWTASVLPQAPATLARLEQGGRLLDVGAGAVYGLVHYAQRFPAAEVVGLELDEPSVALARQAVTEAGVADRVEIRQGDANQLDEVGAYDLVTMNVTLHETGGPEEYRNVLARVHRALRAAGTLLVAELPYPDAPEAYREQPAYRLLAGVQLHETLVGCGAITQGELPALLEGAGFTAVRVAEQPLPTRFVMLAEKPA